MCLYCGNIFICQWRVLLLSGINHCSAGAIVATKKEGVKWSSSTDDDRETRTYNQRVRAVKDEKEGVGRAIQREADEGKNDKIVVHSLYCTHPGHVCY